MKFISKYILLLITIILFFNIQIKAQKYNFSQVKMGSEMMITVDASDTTGLTKSIFIAFQLTDSLIKIFSDYDPDSELNKISLAPANIPIKVSNEMSILLKKSKAAYYLSEGAFDITLGKLTKAWRITKETGKSINPDTLTFYKRYTGSDQYNINQNNNILIKKNGQFHFDLGGIAKGYIAQQVSKLLYNIGWKRHLIDAGGDMVAGEAPFGSCGWKIAFEIPDSDQILQKVLYVKNQAIATSGSTYQFYVNGDKIFSHIIQPKTGLGISNANNVTVISSSGADADWLATACSILPLEKAKKLIKRIPGTTLIITSPESKSGGYHMFGKKIPMYQPDNGD